MKRTRTLLIGRGGEVGVSVGVYIVGSSTKKKERRRRKIIY
jgi:hypothetical protein